MKIAVLNNSGNVGKTTVARQLLAPRLGNCPIFFVESINEAGTAAKVRGRELRQVLVDMALVDHAIVDIGSSNIEAVYAELARMRQAHREFDCYVVPAAPSTKQQRDTINTLSTLLEMGVGADRIRLVFNMLAYGARVEHECAELAGFARARGIACDAVIRTNDVFELIGDEGLADYLFDIDRLKAELAAEGDPDEKRRIATTIGIARLAHGMNEELDAVFATMFQAAA
jgi:hypothetical protein